MFKMDFLKHRKLLYTNSLILLCTNLIPIIFRNPSKPEVYREFAGSEFGIPIKINSCNSNFGIIGLSICYENRPS